MLLSEKRKSKKPKLKKENSKKLKKENVFLMSGPSVQQKTSGVNQAKATGDYKSLTKVNSTTTGKSDKDNLGNVPIVNLANIPQPSASVCGKVVSTCQNGFKTCTTFNSTDSATSGSCMTWALSQPTGQAFMAACKSNSFSPDDCACMAAKNMENAPLATVQQSETGKLLIAAGTNKNAQCWYKPCQQPGMLTGFFPNTFPTSGCANLCENPDFNFQTLKNTRSSLVNFKIPCGNIVSSQINPNTGLSYGTTDSSQANDPNTQYTGQTQTWVQKNSTFIMAGGVLALAVIIGIVFYVKSKKDSKKK